LTNGKRALGRLGTPLLAESGSKLGQTKLGQAKLGQTKPGKPVRNRKFEAQVEKENFHQFKFRN